MERVANIFAAKFRQLFGNRISQPERPVIDKIATWYIRRMMLKVEVTASMQKVKTIIREAYEELCADADVRRCVVVYDVDPV